MDLEAAFERHHESLFRYLHRLVGDADVAADLAQESFVRLLDQDVPEAQVKSWLFTVGTNLVRDRARTRGRRARLLRQPEAEPERPADPEERTVRLERIESVRTALSRLSDRDREILLMREEGFRYAEIARVIGVKPSSVGTLLARALRRFAEAYEAVPAASAGDERRGNEKR